MNPTELHEELIRCGRMVAIGRLTPALIHDINNSLLVLLGIADLELAMLPPESKERERMEMVRDAGGEIRESVALLSSFTRAPIEDERALSLVETGRLAAELVRGLRLQKDIGFDDAYTIEKTPVTGNEGLLIQALLHLLTNAFLASSSGDTVKLEIVREGENAVALVSDNGPGVDPAQAEQIFETFTTTRYAQWGSGIGLAAAREIARGFGGDVELRPSDAGALFALRLPLAG